MLRKKFLTILLTPVIVIGCVVQLVHAQEALDDEIHVISREDGRAFIYHGQSIPLSHGFHVYRSMNGEDWEKLTDEPRYPAKDGFEFQKMVGDLYPRVEQMVERENPQAVFLRVRNNSDIGMITSFAIPEVAQAVGRLYIDQDAPIGETVYYRFEIVDDLERTVNERIEGRTDLQPVYPPAPSGVDVTNEANDVTVKWNYVASNDPNAGNVIRFQIFYREEGGNDLVKANERFIARTIGDTEYQYKFRIPELGKNYIFTVHAVDFTGQVSDASEEKTVLLEENVPPAIIRNVKASATDRYHSQITWPVSTDLDLAGYHIYRARGDEESYKRLTADLITPLETAFLDSTVEPGNQYRYTVTAIDNSKNEGPRSNPAHVLITDYRIPDPVETFDAQYNDEGVQLEWTGGEIPGDLRTYFLLRRQIHPRSGRSFTQINDTRWTDTTFLDPGIGGERFVEGAVYEYGISVISENGNSSDTVYVELQIPDLTPPEAPSFIRAEMEEGQRISLRWNASPSTDVDRYRIYRSTEAAPDTLLAEVSRGKRYLRDEHVMLGTQYVYSVAAVDSLDNESVHSKPDTLVARRLNPPVPARNVQAMETDQGVILSWESSSDDQVVGYRIYQSQIATGIYKPIGETDNNAVEWTDEEGQAGFWYKVFPIDAAKREARSATATQAIERNSR